MSPDIYKYYTEAPTSGNTYTASGKRWQTLRDLVEIVSSRSSSKATAVFSISDISDAQGVYSDLKSNGHKYDYVIVLLTSSRFDQKDAEKIITKPVTLYAEEE